MEQRKIDDTIYIEFPHNFEYAGFQLDYSEVEDLLTFNEVFEVYTARAKFVQQEINVIIAKLNDNFWMDFDGLKLIFYDTEKYLKMTKEEIIQLCEKICFAHLNSRNLFDIRKSGFMAGLSAVLKIIGSSVSVSYSGGLVSTQIKGELKTFDLNDRWLENLHPDNKLKKV